MDVDDLFDVLFIFWLFTFVVGWFLVVYLITTTRWWD